MGRSEVASMPKTYKEIMSEARTLVPELSPAEVKQKLDRGEKPLLLDVREKEEYRDGHLEGGVFSRSVSRKQSPTVPRRSSLTAPVARAP
jgi:rhodanese-related sulfurtransferase